MKKIHYTIIIPFYNEEDNVAMMIEKVAGVVERLTGNYEIIAIDDGSSDNTFKILKSQRCKWPELRIIKFRRNFGQTPAMQ
ncbi:MAG: glycosyltransferase, partial [Proteobacteria bacterium]|nr:glycosyltransferase [Pseudomonadota bacterium]